MNSLTLTNEDLLIKAISKNGLEILDYVDLSDEITLKYIERITNENLNYPLPNQYNHLDWMLPEKYLNMNIEQYLFDRCPIQNQERLTKELELYNKNKMFPVLKAMVYIVDVMRKHNIVWGVGRGSSVASYALFLIGIHKIDSVKYNLSINEFLKGDANG